MLKKLLPGFLVAAILFVGVAPVASSALDTGDVQAQIQALLAKIQELTKQLNDLREQLSKIPPSPTPSTPTTRPIELPYLICRVVPRTLTFGGSGDDVHNLQEFLKGEGFLKAEPTGYFGSLTQDAVMKWQIEYGVVNSDGITGSGAGVFGPKSREFLKIRCKGIHPGYSERFNASPTRGDAPLTVTFSTWLSGFRPNTITYTIDFGDGTSAPATSCPAPADACTGPGTNTHTYTENGTYVATLAKIIDPCAGQTACRAAIHREIVAKQIINVGPVACTKEYRPVCGAQPITCITTPCNPIPTTYSNKCMMEAAKATFLYEGQCRPTTATSTNPADDPQCKIWYDGCNNCSRSTPGGPGMCTMMACIGVGSEAPTAYCKARFDDTPSNGAPIIKGMSGPTSLMVNMSGTWVVKASDPDNDPLSYSVTWGDEGASGAAQTNTAMASTPFTQATSFTHAYALAGTYTIVIIVRDTAGHEARTSTTVQVTTADMPPVACTLQYDPVCGRPPGCSNTCPAGMYCTAICRLPDAVTYSNKCFMSAAGAMFISRGVCPATTTNMTSITQ